MSIKNPFLKLSMAACTMLLCGVSFAQNEGTGATSTGTGTTVTYTPGTAGTGTPDTGTTSTTSTTSTMSAPTPTSTTVAPTTQPTVTPTASTPAVVNQADAQQKIQDLVKSAADYIKQNGKDAAIAEFNKPNGLFSKGNYYIFAIDNTGMFLANPNQPDLVGKNQYELKSEDGKFVIKDIINLANSGGGWLQYRWKDPTIQAMTCKKSYVMGINNGYLIGSGYYYPPNADGSCSP